VELDSGAGHHLYAVRIHRRTEPDHRNAVSHCPTDFEYRARIAMIQKGDNGVTFKKTIKVLLSDFESAVTDFMHW